MNAFMLSVLFALTGQAGAPRAAPPAIPEGQRLLADGTWTLLHAEFDGKPMGPADGTTVTVRGNTLTYTRANMQCQCRLVFGPNATVRALESFVAAPPAERTKVASRTDAESTKAKTARTTRESEGVYIATADYFCLSIFPAEEATPRVEDGKRAATPAEERPAGATKRKNKIVLILRKPTSASDRTR